MEEILTCIKCKAGGIFKQTCAQELLHTFKRSYSCCSIKWKVDILQNSFSFITLTTGTFYKSNVGEIAENIFFPQKINVNPILLPFYKIWEIPQAVVNLFSVLSNGSTIFQQINVKSN